MKMRVSLAHGIGNYVEEKAHNTWKLPLRSYKFEDEEEETVAEDGTQ